MPRAKKWKTICHFNAFVANQRVNKYRYLFCVYQTHALPDSRNFQFHCSLFFSPLCHRPFSVQSFATRNKEYFCTVQLFINNSQCERSFKIYFPCSSLCWQYEAFKKVGSFKNLTHCSWVWMHTEIPPLRCRCEHFQKKSTFMYTNPLV